MAATSVTIVGAGIGGLAMALSLQRAGIPVEVYEQAPEVSEVGAGIMMTPNASRVLRHLGVLDAVLDQAQRPGRTSYRDYRTGERIAEVAFTDAFVERYGSPFVTLHRAELQGILLDAVLRNDREAVHLNQTLVGAENRGDQAIARFTGGHEVTSDLLIAADGIRSTVRHTLFDAAAPRFTGNVAYRCLVPVDRLSPVHHTADTSIWVGPKSHIVHYTVKKGTYMNYVAIVESAGWHEEGWNVRADVRDVLASFDGWHEEFLELIRNTPAELCAKWGMFDREPIARWSEGRITLLGDAAHPTLPFMAQGAAMALEDSVVLGRAIERCSDVRDALAAYEAARHERTAWIQLRSRFFGDLYHRRASHEEISAERAKANDVLYAYDAAAA